MYVRRKRTTLMPAVALAALGAIVAMPLLSSPRLHAASPEHFTTVDGNVQETVDRIMAANHLESAAVYPGERLRIPR